MNSLPFFWSTAMVRGALAGRDRPSLTWRHLPGIDLQDDVFLHQVDKNIALCIRADKFRSSAQVERTHHLAFLESTTVALWVLRLKVKTRFVAGSKTVGPGSRRLISPPRCVASVFVLKDRQSGSPAVADKATIQFRINYGKVNTRRVVDLSDQLS